MKTAFLIAGILSASSGACALLLALLFRHTYRHLLDGSAEQYARLRRRSVLFFIIGIALVCAGVLCLLTRNCL